MSIPVFSRDALGFCAALAVLAACGGRAQSPLAPLGAFQQSGAQLRLSQVPAGLGNTAGGLASLGISFVHANDARSWMSPDAAKTKDLLYITNLDQNASGIYTVSVYSYPEGKLMGALRKDFSAPDGLCVDKKQDIWIVNNGFSEGAVEYRHGGKSPIATVERAEPNLVACAVDSTTGNLAITSYGTTNGTTAGSVSIYAHAKGTPKVYMDSEMSNMFHCAYDSKGNLYVDGLGHSEFAELPKGKKTFKNITLKGGNIFYPGGVQVDGKYVVVGDQQYLGGSPPISAVYQTTGAGGKIVGVTVLDPSVSQDVVQFWIQGNTIIGPNGAPGGHDAGFYKYPAGGKPTKTITKGLHDPYGAVISE